jgi:predicted ATPase with chaperone activity
VKKRHLHRRFLVPNARRGNGLGYDNRPQRILNGTLAHVDEPAAIEKIASCTAMCDEPECISEGIVSYTETAMKAATLRHAAEVQDAREARKTMTVEQRIASARGRAKQRRIDVSHNLHLVEKALIRAVRGGRQPNDSTLRRLEAVEAQLDGAAAVEKGLDRAA